MTDAYRFDESSTEKAIAYAKIYAGTNYSPAMETVLKVAFSEKRNLPTFRLKSSDTILLSGYMKKWVGAYLAGYNNRPRSEPGIAPGHIQIRWQKRSSEPGYPGSRIIWPIK